MKLILVRHAVTQETGKRLSGRTPGIPLSTKGAAAASQLAAELSGIEVAALYSSPIQRCYETAEILGAAHGRRPRVRREIIEVEYGDWSGRTLRSLYRLKAWKTLMADPSSFRFPAGETLEEVRRRSARFVDRLAARHEKETVVAVSHGDVIRSIIAHSLNESVELIHRLHVAPLGISVLYGAAGLIPQVAVVNAPRL